MLFKSKNEEVTAPEVRAAIHDFKALAKEIESETNNVTTLCSRLRQQDREINALMGQLAHARDTAEALKLATRLQVLCEGREKSEAHVNELADTGGKLARKIVNVADTTLIKLGSALSKISALQALQGE